jgi:hypothetical protein
MCVYQLIKKVECLSGGRGGGDHKTVYMKDEIVLLREHKSYGGNSIYGSHKDDISYPPLQFSVLPCHQIR